MYYLMTRRHLEVRNLNTNNITINILYSISWKHISYSPFNVDLDVFQLNIYKRKK